MWLSKSRRKVSGWLCIRYETFTMQFKMNICINVLNLSGKWVLQKQYVEESFANGKWLDEESYEWLRNCIDVTNNNKLNMLCDAPRKWRLYFQSNKGGAFNSWTAAVHFNDKKTKAAYER